MRDSLEVAVVGRCSPLLLDENSDELSPERMREVALVSDIDTICKRVSDNTSPSKDKSVDMRAAKFAK